ncbi:MAG: amidohydrolase [Phycisphaerales bacterium]|nr:MAG: amidohydrolase [Phycisphaerales bacterium]
MGANTDVSIERALWNVQQGRHRESIKAVMGTLLAVGASAYSPPAPATETEENPEGRHADLVIVNARIWTGVGPTADSGAPAEPTALAVVGDKLVAVGDDAAIRAWIKERTQVIDAGGRRVIPGITDSHTHIVSGGFQLARLNLRDVGSRREFVQAVAAEAKANKKGQWVLGGRWSVESWDKPETPNKSWLDPVTRDIPVLLRRMDGHSALANSAALRLAGIDASGPPDPKGGEIQRDPNTGEPTGILKESAMELVGRLIPDPTPDENYEALRRAMKHANSLGVTSIHNMSSRAELEAFRRAEREGTLTVRITAYLSVSDWASNIDKIPGYGLDSDMVRLAGFKGFMDGSLGSRTAYMRKPYNDAAPETPYPRGQLTAMADPPESFQQNAALADSRGLQLAVHAIGDEANHLLLDAYEYAGKRSGRRDARHRLEHAQHLHVTDIPRFAKLGVVASMQPFHKADDGRYAEDRLGKKRLEGSYAFRQLVDAGALVIFGSDWPVVTLNPFAGIDSAVNAKTLAGQMWLPSHSLTVDEALRAYTVSPPKAINRDERLGTIEVGKYADIVILSEDPLTIPKERLAEVRVAQTIVGGKVVFDRSE